MAPASAFPTGSLPSPGYTLTPQKSPGKHRVSHQVGKAQVFQFHQDFLAALTLQPPLHFQKLLQWF